MILGNPYGLFALLGIPAVLLIHFLQRKAQIVPISTLFLLEKTQRESTTGRRFDRLTNSLSLWLQLLLVLLLTWLLVDPRFSTKAVTRQVAVVIDSSASLSVFKEKAKDSLSRHLNKLSRGPAQLQISLLSSDPREPSLYTGNSPSEALQALDKWQPVQGAREPSAALRLARSRIRSEGLLIYLTDNIKRKELPYEAQLLAVGEKKNNLGFTGVSFDNETRRWQATVRNYSNKAVTRTWKVISADNSTSPEQSLSLEANALTVLSGEFPESIESLTVALTPDDFPLDNLLPLVWPQPKTLSLSSDLPNKFTDFEKRFLAALGDATNAGELPDLTLTAYDPLNPTVPQTHAIITIDEKTRSRRYLSGGIVQEAHKLNKDLNWQALQARESINFPLLERDTILLWQGERPLIALREETITDENSEESRTVRHLIFNFDLTQSNALKLPSTILLLHRFVSELRKEKIAPSSLNTELGQPLDLTYKTGAPLTLKIRKPGEDESSISLSGTKTFFAPTTPCHYTITQEGKTLLSASAAFADTREADLREAASFDEIDSSTNTIVAKTSTSDELWPYWTLLGFIALISSWGFVKQKKPSPILASNG